MSPEELDAAMAEIAILRQIRHPNIVRYQDSFKDANAGVLNIVMEYASGGDLAMKIKAREGSLLPLTLALTLTLIQAQQGSCFEEGQILGWLLEITMAMEYLHTQR